MGEKMRLDKLLALLGEGTRSEIKAMVRAGRVTVDGAGARDAGMQVDGAQSDVRLDGRRLCYKAVRHVMLNKPSGVLTAARDKKQKTVMDLLPPMYAAMGAMPAGRLDKDTEGLLLFTNDGDLAHRLLAPKRHIEKTYYAEHLGTVTEEDIRVFREGCVLREGVRCLPAVLEPIGEGRSIIRVCEGKYHQVRRMMASRRLPVVYLRRVAAGGVELGELPLGMTRELTEEEISGLESVNFDENFF